jgi:hypothetical protein
MFERMNRAALFLAVAAACLAAVAPEDQILWKDPGDVQHLDLAAGPGGKAGKPSPPFTFIKEDMSGTHPRVQVRDAHGRTWSVKFGNEVHSEPFASRIAWATGYFVEPMYYVARGTIRGVHGLKRAASSIEKNGTFREARFQFRDPAYKFMEENNWSWSYNPFHGTRELNGLKIIIALTSNWDNKDARDEDGGPNTGILERKNGEHPRYIYIFSDWGGSMGNWGNVIRRSNWSCADFASDTPEFVSLESGSKIHWGYHGKHTDFLNDVTINDVEWIYRYLGRIQDSQIQSALIESGATPTETDCFSGTLRRRIKMLRQLITSSHP